MNCLHLGCYGHYVWAIALLSLPQVPVLFSIVLTMLTYTLYPTHKSRLFILLSMLVRALSPGINRKSTFGYE